MHMADAMLSPAVGSAFWLASAGLLARAVKKITVENDPAKTPLMAVMAAFVFAAQMINFSIPGTGSSGHLGGGLLLAILLGPHRAFVALTTVLIVQCLFFADGGLLALGCNVCNMAFFPAYIAYPWIFKKIMKEQPSPARLATGSLLAAEAGLLLGALAVVIQTTLSGITELPFGKFVLFMLPIHFAIGLVEGMVTWAVVAAAQKTQPDLLRQEKKQEPQRRLLLIFVMAAMVVGGILSWTASSFPDGLEWSVGKVTGEEESAGKPSGLAHWLGRVQEKAAFLPDYAFKKSTEENAEPTKSGSPVDLGTTTSGIVGAMMVLILSGLAGFVIRLAFKPAEQK